jgi:hypothetical protein
MQESLALQIRDLKFDCSHRVLGVNASLGGVSSP